jgi:protein-disulfide isomerase
MSKRAGQKQATRMVREQLAAERRRRRTTWTALIAVGVLIIAGLVGWAASAAQRPGPDFAVPAGVTDIGGDHSGLHVAGDGPVTVEVYLDFICPACRQFEESAGPALDQLLAENKITLVWHTLGFLDDASTTDYSTRAASAAGCASDGGKLNEYGEALFARQPPEGGSGLSDDELIEIGGPVGLNAPAFAQCVRGLDYRDWVDHVNASAARRGVNATPSVFVDGTLLDRPTVDSLQAAVAAAG